MTTSTLTTAFVVYDGECGFCRSCVRFLDRRIRTRISSLAYQAAPLDALGLTREACEEEVQLLIPIADRAFGHGVGERGSTVHDSNRHGTTHRVYSGSAAVGRALRLARFPWNLVGLAIAAPGIRRLAAYVYGIVARRRRCTAPTPPVG